MRKLRKKNANFLFFDWTDCRLMIILCALFVLVLEENIAADDIKKDKSSHKKRSAEKIKELRLKNSLLQKENNLLRNELIEIYKREESRKARIKRLEQGVAKMLIDSEAFIPSKENSVILSDLKNLRGDTIHLSESTLKFLNYIQTLVAESSLKKRLKAGAQFRILALEKKIERVIKNHGYSQKNGIPRKCRIIAENDELNIFVISVGETNGIRNGMKWFSGKSRNIEMTVVQTRKYISAAVVSKGNNQELSVGMKAYPDKK